MEPGLTDVEHVVAAQRRGRRLRFWFGFFVLALLGGLWAGLSKDPLGNGLFGGDEVFFDGPAAEVAEFDEFDDFDVPLTTVGFEPAPQPTPAPAPETTGPDQTDPPTTVGP